MVAAILPKSAIVIGVAKLSDKDLGALDPAPTIGVSTPGCPIITCGYDKWGLSNAAMIVGAFLALTEDGLATKLEKIRATYKDPPKFDTERVARFLGTPKT